MKNSIQISKNPKPGSSVEQKEGATAKNSAHHLPSLARTIAKIRARKIFNQTKQALRHVQLIEDGQMKAKSIDDVLNEL